MAIEKPVLVMTIGATPRSHLFVNRIAQHHFHVTDDFEERSRYLGVPFVETDRTIDVAVRGVQVRGEAFR